MRRLARLAATSVLVAAAGAAQAGGAQAFWSGGGVGEGLAQVTTLGIPALTATPQEDAVKLSWTAVLPPEPGSFVSYFVRRNGGQPTGGCPSEATPSAATSCLETGIKSGERVTFTVVAVWRSWFAESEPITATSGAPAPAYLELAAARSTVAAGEGDPLTITARAANGQLASGFSGTHQVYFSGAQPAPNGAKPTVSSEGGSSVAFGEPVKLYFKEGVATVSGSANGLLTLYRTERASIVAKAEGLSNEGHPLLVTVGPGPFGSFTATAKPASPTAGQSFSLLVVALDRYGNLDSTYTATGSFAFSGALPSPAPVQAQPRYPSVVPTFKNGEAVVEGFTFYRAGQTTLTIEETGTEHRGTAAITVLPGPAATLSLAAARQEVEVGEGLPVTVKALDAFANVATSFGGSAGETKEAVFSGAQVGPNGRQPTVTAASGSLVPFGKPVQLRFVEGVASTTFTPYRVETAQLVATAGQLSNASSPLAVVVKPGPAQSFAIVPSVTTMTAGEPLSLQITALDAGGNVATSFGGPSGEPKTLSYAGAEPSPNGTPPLYPESATKVTFKEGLGRASGIVLYKAGSTRLTVASGTVQGSVALTVKAGPVYGLAWSEPQVSGGLLEPDCALECVVTNLENGGSFSASIAVADRYGNPQPQHETILVYLIQRRIRGFAFGLLSTFLLELPEGTAASEPFSLTVYSFNFGFGRRRQRGYELELRAVPVGAELPTATARISGP